MKNIPEDLSNKIKNPLQTPANNADPKMALTVVRAKDTVMDNTYWTTEVIRTKPGLGDLSVAARRLKPYGGPDSLYNIYVDNGVVKTAIRAYPDYQKDGWQDQFELGAGTACAICFDGYWARYRGNWQMVTSEKPWLFWVTGGVLYTQYWDDISTRLELASGVSKVKAIRGWKNEIFKEIDQGVMVSYIKTDGKIYYRNYCWQSGGFFSWENERQLTDCDSTYLTHNMFITTDYRMGIIAENVDGEISWIITVRAWAGMASPIENITTSLKDISFNVIPITYHDGYLKENIETAISDLWFNVAEPIYPEPIFAENPDKSITQIILKFSHEIAPDIDLTTVKSAFSIKDSANNIFSILSTQAGTDNSEIIFTCSIFGGAGGNIIIGYDRIILELDCLNQGSRFAIESFNYEFTPELVPQEGHAFEYLTVSLPITFDVTQVYYVNRYNGGENILTSISSITFEVTKVGDSPL